MVNNHGFLTKNHQQTTKKPKKPIKTTCCFRICCWTVVQRGSGRYEKKSYGSNGPSLVYFCHTKRIRLIKQILNHDFPSTLSRSRVLQSAGEPGASVLCAPRTTATCHDKNPIKTYKNNCFFWFFGGFLMVFGQKTMVINHG